MKRYSVRLTERAEADVVSVLEWFAEQEALAAGGKWFQQLMATIDTLETMPTRCPVAAESAELGVEIRERLLGRRAGTYRLLFQIDGGTVYILRVWHAARDQVSGHDL